jgi:surface polysaccharide O-acyltransferase-like enzyme
MKKKMVWFMTATQKARTGKLKFLSKHTLGIYYSTDITVINILKGRNYDTMPPKIAMKCNSKQKTELGG